MKKVVLQGCGCLGILLLLSCGGLYWLTRPANINWHGRTRDGISDLRAVKWEGKNLAGANLSGIIFRESWLKGANLRRANLQGADLSGATYLDDADLRGANLTGAILEQTYARRANFAGAILKEAQLQFAHLSGANLSGVDLAGANLEDANLTGAKLTDWVNPPAYLDRANLTDADWPADLSKTRLCNAILPDGTISKQGCFWPTPALTRALGAQDWRWAENATSRLFQEAGSEEQTAEQLAIDIEKMPCQRLEVLDKLWREASGDRFSFSAQRQIWESPAVRQDYGKFAETIGWKQNGNWLKFEELQLERIAVDDEDVPRGHLPWHRWQVQEPTEAEPTRFRRVGFGAWMKHLKRCGI